MVKKNKKLFPLFWIIFVILIAAATYYSNQLNILKNQVATNDSENGYVTLPELKRHANTKDWNTYKNTIIGYEIKYPKDWNITEESFDPGGATISESSLLVDIYPSDSDKDFLRKLTIEAFPDSLVASIGYTPDEVWGNFEQGFKSWRLREKQIEEVEIGGDKFIFTGGTSSESGNPEEFISKTYIKRINNGEGTLAIILRDKSVPRSGIFDQIIESFRFTSSNN